MDKTDKILDLLSQKSKADFLTGKFAGLDGARVLIDFGSGVVPLESATEYRPVINELVQILRVDGKMLMLGTSQSKPGQGTVLEVDGDFAVIDTDIGEVRAPFPFGVVLAADDIVKLMWQDGPFVVALMSTNPPPEVPDGGSSGSGAIKTSDPFTATWSYQWSHAYNKRQSNYPRASDTVSGAWGYGTKINDNIPDTSTRLKTEIYLPLISAAGACFIGVHDYPNEPGAWTGIAAEVPLVNRGTGWVEIPNAFGDWLSVHNAGIAVRSGDGDTRWVGFPDDALSGAIRITYQLA